ncbi:MAG: hypothetical protein L6Q99_21085 [Planctomycetes bacterium]|nr:hypothetical protein [Planctomycetota bacterium]
MPISFRIAIPAVLLITGFALGATLRQQSNTAIPAPPPQVAGTSGGPAWHESQDVGDGVELETTVRVGAVVTDGAGVAVRPISIHMNFLYGVGLMHQVDYLQLHPLNDTSSLQFDSTGLDRNIVVAQRPPFGALNYAVSATPKPGWTWGTIRGAIDLDIVATPIP